MNYKFERECSSREIVRFNLKHAGVRGKWTSFSKESCRGFGQHGMRVFFFLGDEQRIEIQEAREQMEYRVRTFSFYEGWMRRVNIGSSPYEEKYIYHSHVT